NVSQKTLSEIPMAYKDVFKVMDAQKSSIKIIKYLKPIINWKG
ncbi:RtcB family protein, partial [Candidatus Pacearchaeota archaeon]|nr:RtcB family protein [Candidatus Pacearchaeota archaeon]